MTIRHRRVLSVAVLGAALLISGSGYAQMTGAARDTFVKASFKACSDKLHQSRTDLPNDVVTTYCLCMANGEADITTKADIEYLNEHKGPSPDLVTRIKAIAPRCNKDAGLE